VFLCSEVELCFKYWDSECVVYNVLSGDTYLFDSLSANLLDVLSQKSLTQSQLISTIVHFSSTNTICNAESFFVDWQKRFQKMELIEIEE